MMLALLAANVLAAPPVTTADEIVVTAAKLRKIRLSAQSDDAGRITACQVTVSSGDQAFDRYACEATRDCATAGPRSGEGIADCVDQKMIAFASSRTTGAAEKRN